MFKVGDAVVVIGNESNSRNQVGDEGTIVEIDLENINNLQYRVHVESKHNFGNWHTGEELKFRLSTLEK